MAQFRRLFLLCMVLTLAIVISNSALAQDDDDTLTVISWNVESGEADPAEIAAQIAEFQEVDIWGLVEVDSNDARSFEASAEIGEGTDYLSILGSTGGDDRLVILYDGERFELIDTFELDEINIRGNVRSPLVAHFLDSFTEQEFLFMVNHLWRSNDRGRHEQARMLNQWAAEQDLPVIAVGDYNFDYDIDTGEYDLGYDLMTIDDVFEWVRPDELVSTQCTLDRNDETRCFFNSVLDFIFVSGAARDWDMISEIVVREGDFPDDELTSDHRPVLGVFIVTQSPIQGMTRAEILARIEELEAELAQLRAMLEEMPE